MNGRGAYRNWTVAGPIRRAWRGLPIAVIAVTLATAATAANQPAGTVEPVLQTVPENALYSQVIEDRYDYRAVKGDYLIRIAGMHGVELGYLLEQNPQKSKFVQVGDRFFIDRRTIVPAVMDDGVLVNIPDRTLYVFKGGRLKGHFPVGPGKPDWQTPTGRFTILQKIKDPTWHVPPSIQREMKAAGQKVIESMPPGPDNPLGRWALKTSIPGILLHETTHPESVYRFRSHGCVRMKGVDAWTLYQVLDVGTEGVIAYIPVKLALTQSGRVFLEVHKDVYGKAGDPLLTAVGLIEKNNLASRVDWEKVAKVVEDTDGIAHDVTAGLGVRTASASLVR